MPRIAMAEHTGIGNWLRHQYDRVDVETVCDTVTQDLPPLKASVARALNEPGQ